MRLIPYGIIAAIMLYLLDKLALWAEERGWMYYRNKRGSATGNAFLEIHSFFEPSRRHVIEERKRIKKDAPESGDKPKAG